MKPHVEEFTLDVCDKNLVIGFGDNPCVMCRPGEKVSPAILDEPQSKLLFA
jgi:hypothetical protein